MSYQVTENLSLAMPRIRDLLLYTSDRDDICVRTSSKVSDLVEFERPSDRKPNELVARSD